LPTDYDVSQLTQVVQGYLVSKRSDPRTVIRQLGEIFQFDCVETDYQLKFVPKNTAIVATISQSDMGEVKTNRGTSSGDDNFFKHVKKQETDLPYEVHVKYLDPARNYQFGDQNSRRPLNPIPTMNARAVISFEAPIAMSAADAVKLSQTLLYTEWVERDMYETSLGYKWMHLDPTDGILFTFNNGDNYQARLVEQTIGGDFSQAIRAVAVDNETFYSTATAPTSDNLVVSGSGFSAMTTSVIAFDLPFFYETDAVNQTTAKLWHVCVAYAAGNWPGAQVMSATAGTNYTYDNFQTKLPFAGTLSTVLPATNSPFLIDFKTSINVHPFRPVTTTLASTSTLGLLGGVNWAIVGKEIIGFQNASINADGSYTLTGLLRGLRGTEYACNTHKPGETFILIDESTFSSKPYTSAEVGQTVLFKATTFGIAVDLAPVQTITLSGAGLKPRPVANIARASDGAGGVTVTWTRCTRYGGNLVDGTGTVPLNEATEAYNAYILSAPYDDNAFNENAPTTYVRAFTGLTSPTFTYTAAQAATDSFSPTTDTLHLVVFQVSATVGNGFPSVADLLPH
jgi:hypothetical protein